MNEPKKWDESRKEEEDGAGASFFLENREWKWI